MNSLLNQLLSLRRMEYLVADEELNILEASLGVQRFADCPNEVRKGKDIRLGFPELIGIEEILLAILQGRQSSFELKGIGRFSEHKSFFYIDVYIISNLDEKKFKNKLIIFFEDVTEKMALEQKLVQLSNEASLVLEAWSYSSDYLNKIITSMTNAVIVTSQTGTIKTVNPAVEDLLGYSEKELIGKQLAFIVNQEGLLLEASQQYFFSGNFLKNVEVRCQTKIGEEVVIAFSCSAIQTNIEDVQDFIYVGRKSTKD